MLFGAQGSPSSGSLLKGTSRQRSGKDAMAEYSLQIRRTEL